MAVDDSVPNSPGNRPAPINVETNAVVDSDSDDSSSNKESYLSNDCSSSSNDDHHEDNLDVGRNRESGISSTVPIKKHIRQQEIKALIATICLCMLAYSRSKYANLPQMVAGYFAFAQNVLKRCIEVFHKRGLLVTSKTVRRALTANREAAFQMLCNRVCNKRFFISYDNMNFHEKVQDQRIHNKSHQVAYTAGYIFFMKGPGCLDTNSVNHNTI